MLKNDVPVARPARDPVRGLLSEAIELFVDKAHGSARGEVDVLVVPDAVVPDVAVLPVQVALPVRREAQRPQMSLEHEYPLARADVQPIVVAVGGLPVRHISAAIAAHAPASVVREGEPVHGLVGQLDEAQLVTEVHHPARGAVPVPVGGSPLHRLDAVVRPVEDVDVGDHFGAAPLDDLSRTEQAPLGVQTVRERRARDGVRLVLLRIARALRIVSLLRPVHGAEGARRGKLLLDRYEEPARVGAPVDRPLLAQDESVRESPVARRRVQHDGRLRSWARRALRPSEQHVAALLLVLVLHTSQHGQRRLGALSLLSPGDPFVDRPSRVIQYLPGLGRQIHELQRVGLTIGPIDAVR